GLSSSAAGNVVTLAWTSNDSSATGYLIQRSTNGGQTWNSLTTISSATSNFADSAVTAGSTYAYRVYAMNGNLQSAASNTTTVTVPVPPPGAPSGLSSSAAGNVVTLIWTGNDSAATGYLIQRSTNGGQTWGTLSTISSATSNYADSAVSAGSTYAYRVYAMNGSLQSAASNTSTITVLVPPPAAPSGLSSSAAGNVVTLAWTGNDGSATGYLIQRSADGGAHWSTLTTIS